MAAGTRPSPPWALASLRHNLLAQLMLGLKLFQWNRGTVVSTLAGTCGARVCAVGLVVAQPRA